MALSWVLVASVEVLGCTHAGLGGSLVKNRGQCDTGTLIHQISIALLAKHTRVLQASLQNRQLSFSRYGKRCYSYEIFVETNDSGV